LTGATARLEAGVLAHTFHPSSKEKEVEVVTDRGGSCDCQCPCICVVECTGDIEEVFWREWEELERVWLQEEIHKLAAEAVKRCTQAVYDKFGCRMSTQPKKEAFHVEA
jgi:hypothetical protein